VAPPEVLRELKRVNPYATLLYIGEGRWWLGLVELRWLTEDNVFQKRVDAIKSLDREYGKEEPYRNRTNMIRSYLKLRGFAFIARFEGEPTGRIVRDLEEREFNYRNNFALFEAKMLAATDGSINMERAAKGAADAGRYLAKQAFRTAVNKPTSFSAAPAPKAAGATSH
jgi:hypothetical protein